MIRVLPESYRRSDTLEVASHVVVIPQEAASSYLKPYIECPYVALCIFG
jgi:hypothetical protein